MMAAATRRLTERYGRLLDAIARALLPYVPVVLAGPEAWAADDTIRKAIEIRDGQVTNPKILRFQNRAVDYPHERLG